MKEDKRHLYKLCPHCDYFCNILEEINFCPVCGNKLIEQCTHCQTQIVYPYANYCGFCGKKYRDEKKQSSFKEL